jgi:hypothetical protein
LLNAAILTYRGRLIDIIMDGMPVTRAERKTQGKDVNPGTHRN